MNRDRPYFGDAIQLLEHWGRGQSTQSGSQCVGREHARQRAFWRLFVKPFRSAAYQGTIFFSPFFFLLVDSFLASVVLLSAGFALGSVALASAAAEFVEASFA